MFDLRKYLLEKQNRINGALAEICRNRLDSGPLSEAMNYSLMAGGKRLRPVLCIAAAETVGESSQDVMEAACALEMIHTYSLIHDDLPAIDNDELRRGKPTCHVAFGEATAILAGDALLTLAFHILSSPPRELSSPDALKRIEVIRMISLAAGCRGMIEGQMRDIASEDCRLNMDDLEALHLLKTGAMIEASVCSGAVLADGRDEQVQQLRTYARHIGLAFQVVDDILNVEGDPSVMGKAAGTDSLKKKSTYPSMMGLDRSREFAAALVENASRSLSSFDSRAEPLHAIARYIIERKK